MRRTLPLLLLTALALPAPALQAPASDAATPAPGSVNAGKPGKAGTRKADKPWALEAFYSVVTDSNLNQDEYDTNSTGYIGGLEAEYVLGLPFGEVKLKHETARHSYTNTTTWDRTTHDTEVTFAYRLGRKWHLETSGEAALKDAADGEIRDEYTLRQVVEYRFTPVYRLRIEGGQRIKDYDYENDKDAHDPYIEVALDTRPSGSRRLEAGYRFDHNDARESKRSYRRSTLGALYEQDYGKRDTATAEVRYRLYGYTDRLVYTSDGVKPRHDRRWVVEYRWDHELGKGLTLRLEYCFENRRSNDTDRAFDDRLYGASLIQRW